MPPCGPAASTRAKTRPVSLSPAPTWKKAVGKKNQQKTAKNTKKTDQEAYEDGNEDENDVEEPEKMFANLTVDWMNTLTWKLIRAITDNQNIQRVIYPSPGPNLSTQKGSRKSKAKFYAMAAEDIFTDDPEYGSHYANDKASGNKKKISAWAKKVKNHPEKINKTVKAHMNKMEQTGEGIYYAGDINRTEGSAVFVNLCDEILADCPWFFEVKRLIAQCPNLNPVGLGNATTAVDLTILNNSEARGTNNNSEKEELNDGDGVASIDPGPRLRKSFVDNEYSSDDSLDELPAPILHADNPSRSSRATTSESDAPAVSVSTSTGHGTSKALAVLATTVTKQTKRTAARAGISTPAGKLSEPTGSKSKKAQVEDRFAEVYVEEEKTQRLILEAKIAQIKLERDRINAKLEEKRIKADIACEKLQLEFKERCKLLESAGGLGQMFTMQGGGFAGQQAVGQGSFPGQSFVGHAAAGFSGQPMGHAFNLNVFMLSDFPMEPEMMAGQSVAGPSVPAAPANQPTHETQNPTDPNSNEH